MRMALALAEKGKGRTSPNPMVGAVVVKKDRILGEGFHQKFGGPHAEAIALKACRGEAKGATLYTTLEPCCHFGKTPPCTDIIIQSGIRKVICATVDPNPQVNGRGLKSLREKGIKVRLGILEKEAKKLNEVYFKYITTELPFVMLKISQTLDGRIIHPDLSVDFGSEKFFSELIKTEGLWIDAVLYDASSFETESVKTLLESGNFSKSKVILMGGWEKILSRFRKIKREARKNFVLVPTDLESIKAKKGGQFKIWKIKRSKNQTPELVSLLKKAGEEKITTLLLGGGAEMVTQFLKQGLVDKIWYFISLQISGRGQKSLGDLGVRKLADAIVFKNCEYQRFKEGLLVAGYPN